MNSNTISRLDMLTKQAGENAKVIIDEKSFYNLNEYVYFSSCMYSI